MSILPSYVLLHKVCPLNGRVPEPSWHAHTVATVSQLHVFSDSSSATLMSCLMGLQKAVHHGVLGPVPVTLYRTLYIYYKRHHNSALQQEIFK